MQWHLTIILCNMNIQPELFAQLYCSYTESQTFELQISLYDKIIPHNSQSNKTPKVMYHTYRLDMFSCPTLWFVVVLTWTKQEVGPELRN